MAKKRKAMSRERAAHIPNSEETIGEAERAIIIDRTGGSLTAAEGDELARIIEETCERADERA